MRLILVLILAVVLSGCEDREAARVRNEQRLPNGCRIIDLDYGDLKAAVVCEGRKTPTSLRSWQDIVMVYDPNLKMMTTQYIPRSAMNVEIGSRE